MMKARDIFGVVVRGVGLCLLLISSSFLVYAGADIFNAFHNPDSEADVGAYFLIGGSGFFAGFVLMRFARLIVRFCYPEGKDDSEE
jgi:hypothetical protein